MYTKSGMLLAQEPLFFFLLELVSVMIFNFISNFLDSLDVSRDKGQESAFIP